jgi:hypothetical protein
MVDNLNLIIFRIVGACNRLCMIKCHRITEKRCHFYNICRINIYFYTQWSNKTNFYLITKSRRYLTYKSLFKGWRLRLFFFATVVVAEDLDGDGEDDAFITEVDEEEILVLGLLAAAALGGDGGGVIEDGELVVSPDLFFFESSLILLNLRPFDLFLQQHCALDQRFRSRGTSRNIYIYWDNSIDTRKYII